MKVRCATCSNVKTNTCAIKKVGVKVNKPRLCEQFSFDISKVKEHRTIESIKFGYAEQQEAKRLRREEKRRQEALNSVPVSTAHPLTGDLSRFTTTASE